MIYCYFSYCNKKCNRKFSHVASAGRSKLSYFDPRFWKTGTLANKSTKQNMPHLKLGIVSNFGGIGPENKLFSIFLHNNKSQVKNSSSMDWCSCRIYILFIYISKKYFGSKNCTDLGEAGLAKHKGSQKVDCFASVCKCKMNKWINNNQHLIASRKKESIHSKKFYSQCGKRW